MKAVNIILMLVYMLFTLSYTEENLKLFDKVSVIVNDQPILKSEIKLAKQWFNLKSDKEATEKLINQVLLYQLAKRNNIKVMPDEVQNAILKIALTNNIKSIKEFKQFLSKQDISYIEFSDLIKREIAISKYVQFILKPKVLQNSKEAVEETYRVVRIIYIAKDSKDFQKIYQYLKQNLNKQNFEELAKQYSQDPITKNKGGLLGSIKKGELLKQLDEKIWQAKVGEVVETEIQNGVYFILVEKEFKKLVPREISQEKVMEKLSKELELQLKKEKEKAIIQIIDKSLQ